MTGVTCAKMIVHITHQLPPETHGGVESHALALAQAQKKRGHQVVIIAGSLIPWESVGGEAEVLDGIDVFRVHRQDLFFDAWDRMYCPQMADLIVAKLQELKPDVVHMHHWIRLSQDLGRRITDAGMKLVLTLHDLATSCPRGFRMRPDEDSCFEELNTANCLHCAPRWPWMSDEETSIALELFAKSSRSELAGAHAVVCATESVKSIVLDGLNAEALADRFHVLPFGHEPIFGELASQEVKSDDVFRFAFWGSIAQRKGVELLVDAFAELANNRPDDGVKIELHIFGVCDLPERETALREAAKGLNVIFHGRFEHNQIAAANINAAVFPSRCIETYGLVLDEAFELGIPVVVPDLGALKERSGAAGRLFTPNDVGSLACALGALVDDPALYESLKASIPKSLPRFEAHVDAIFDLYSQPTTPPDPAFAPIEIHERTRHQFLRSQSQFRRLIDRGEADGYGPR
ncbi:MAG: glycosyltransferase involved in cell wall biosynthesis [Planctomycetota bacterium]|jgi:glycosyltransferase involved in cell wall biosynthesis